MLFGLLLAVLYKLQSFNFANLLERLRCWSLSVYRLLLMINLKIVKLNVF